MKKIKIILSMIVLIIILIMQTIKAQTNVSGGIYSNTTWTTANSPYIVTDTIVVFPNVTLTIQLGVILRFNNNKRLEIRQASLIALGTITDSITFTSNSVTPTAGIWSCIYFNGGTMTSNFNFCNFRYAVNAIYSNINNSSNVEIQNSTFKNNSNAGVNGGNPSNAGIVITIDSCLFYNNNNYGVYGVFGSTVSNCSFHNNSTGLFTECFLNLSNSIFRNNQTGLYIYCNSSINNCIFNSNQIGIDNNSNNSIIQNCIVDSNYITGIASYNDNIENCQIKNNGIGINLSGSLSYISKNIIEYNNIGVKLAASTHNINCNRLCNNISYDFYYNVQFGNNFNISYNYWCTTDSVIIATHIYDGYDNINLGLVTFMPLDTSQCYLTTEIKEKEINNISFNIFPNPACDKLTIILPKNNLQTEVKIYNLIGQLEFISKIENISTELNILKLTNGIYIIELTIDDKIIRKKFIKQ